MKRLLQNPLVLICVGVVLFFSIIMFSKYREKDLSSLLQQAQVAYKNGEQSKTIPERTKAFNRSLEILLGLEREYSPTFGNGKLDFNLGNNFFQLEEYPHALLHYYRAELLRPRDKKVLDHIAIAEKKLGLSLSENKTAIQSLLFFHYRLSLPERLQLFFFLSLLVFLLASCYIWLNRRWLFQGALILMILSLPVLMSIGYSFALSPLEAILVKSNLLYRDAGIYYSKVNPEPLLSGLKVKVLEVTDEGRWIKVETKEGTTGYLPEESIRII